MRRLIAISEAFPLARPFRISRGVKVVADVVTVAIEQDGCTGRGEGAPYPRYGESVETALAAIAAASDAIEDGATRCELQSLMPAGAARNAVDCALWDLEARRSGTSVGETLGTPARARMPTAMTIGIDTPASMAEAATVLRNVPLLKVKVDREQIEERLRAVRTAAPDPRMIVDPNESWVVNDIEKLMPLLVELRVDLLEQPVPADDDAGLANLSPAIPIAADEAMHTRDDLDRLAGKYQVINIKLDKTGGLTEAQALADAAQAHGFGLMMGCMISTSLSIAPAWHIAARSVFADLDGPLWLSQDRAGGFVAEDGSLCHTAAGFWGDC